MPAFRFFLVPGAMLLAAAAAAAAQEGLTPERALAIALENHPAIRAADRQVDAAEAGTRLARSGWLPRIEFTEEYIRSTDPVFVFGSKLRQERFGPADFAVETLNEPDPFSNAVTRLTLRQNVWDAGRTGLHREAADLSVGAATESGERTREEVAFRALRAFWDTVVAEEMLRVAGAAEKAAEANATLAADRVETGLAVPSDRMQAEVRLAEVRADRIRAEQEAVVARAALREALGMKTEADFLLDPPVVRRPDPGESLDARVAEALASRPDFRAMDLHLRQATVGEKMARSRWLPEIGVGAQYEWNSHNLFGGDGSNWTVGASVTVPIFDGMEAKARRDRARAERSRLEADREAMAEGIRLEVHAAWARRQSAAERLETAESALELAGEALRIVRERYAEGMAVMVELLGAEAARTQAQGNRAGAVRDLAIANASLDLASARTLGARGSEDDQDG